MLTKEKIDQMISTFTDHINEGKITPNHKQDCGYCLACQTAIDLAAEVERLKAERRWVPVGERLQGKTGMYLVVYLQKPNSWTHTGPELALFDGERWECEWDCGDFHEYVTHWMPLPNAPKEEQG